MSAGPSPFVRVLAALAVLLLTGVAAAREPVVLTHVHGLTFGADGKRLYVSSHHGLAVFEAGRWSAAPGPQHDLMGFTATHDRFYSSGHPAPGTGLPNPFGLIRSDDGGKTWQLLGLQGEGDFHLLATGYGSNAVYVFNHEPNSRMSSIGIYYTLDDGRTWTRATAVGLREEVLAIAVHPEDPKTVAVGTRSGVFLSEDSGEHFRRVRQGQPLALFFDLDGRHLWFGGHDGAPTLQRMDLEGGGLGRATLPPLEADAVAYIAQNPVRRDEYAIATFKRSIFLSRDGGKTWLALARLGRTSGF